MDKMEEKINEIVEKWKKEKAMFPHVAIPLRLVVLFKGQRKEVSFQRVNSVNQLHKVFSDNTKYVVLTYQKSIDVENPTPHHLSKYGTLCLINKKRSEFTKDNCVISFQALARVRIIEYLGEKNSISPVKIVLDDVLVNEDDEKEEKELVTNISSKFLELNDKVAQRHNQPNNAKINIQINNSSEIIMFLIHHLRIPYLDLLGIFEQNTIVRRLEKILEVLVNYSKFTNFQKRIDSMFREQLSKKQKEYFLREKIAHWREELNKLVGEMSVAEGFRKKLKEGKYPDNIKRRIEDEIDRYDASPKSSADANITRQYIETLLELPWLKETTDVIDLEVARKELNKNHFGLEKVKERIIEQLAVVFYNRKEGKDSKQTSIICLVGPPGVGKTSLGQSIANAMGRKFVRVALGGIRDEAEIRGHRKTYVGAMPGRIIKAIKKVGVRNPLFLLDEVDKMASDYRGDPSSAMLEVLDPEQNKSFNDNYVEEDFDLSKVIFICTANTYDAIPDALLDRMEVIHLSSYTEQEKLHIAKDHLLAKVLNVTGLTKKQIRFSDSAIMEIIRRYTREAGVRELQRLLEKVARVILVKLTDDQDDSKRKIVITKKSIIDYLKKPIYDYQRKDTKKIPGLVNGLAYTAYGGDVLPVEATFFQGTGKLTLTGRLGEVFRESANISMNYIKSHAKTFNIQPEFFEKHDIHIHCPEGAVPKDGPSAGVTITSAILSIIRSSPISNNLGMTGEMTLHGQVLTIGGLREKVISAHRTGLKTVLYPKNNMKDLDDIPDEVKKSIEMIPVETYMDVYAIAFPKAK